MEVVATCLHWTQPVAAHSPSSSTHTLWASAISSLASKRRRNHRALVFCRLLRQSDRPSALFGRTPDADLSRTRSYEFPTSTGRFIRRALSDSFAADSFSDEEFARTLEELSRSFDLTNEEDSENRSELEHDRNRGGEFSGSAENRTISPLQNMRPFDSVGEPPWVVVSPKPPEWPQPGAIIPASVEWKANSVELPLSLRMIQRKKQWQEGFREAGESAYCSVKKAFSSMVFIIRELQSYTLHMRELLFYEDLQGILARVQKELNASFVWLFQQIFSQTPTLMVYVMILLANFTVYSMGNNAALAAVVPPAHSTSDSAAIVEERCGVPTRFDSSSVKSFSVTGRSAEVGGNSGGGGKASSVAGATDGGDLRSNRGLQHRTIVPDEMSTVSSVGNVTASEEEEVVVPEREEARVWNVMVEEAGRMQAHLRDGVLDQETMQRFVSPVKAEMEPDDYADYRRTELNYQLAVMQEPDNPLLLSNYAQFLHLVVHDHDRAEEFFKRAVRIQPPDAESLSRYASFLWLVRKDIAAAEETYLEAIAADPANAFHASNYANFLWNTGGEETCFPLT